MSNRNPWRGLASYDVPKGEGNDYQFCGRDEETLDVVRLVDNNLFITLYGSSGIGKTSLLKAGVIPILKRREYHPIYVRLSQEPTEIPYAEAIVRRLKDSELTEERSIEMEHPDSDDRLYLWNYFATTRFLNPDDPEREIYPVIILDQFEEVFRDGDKAKAELLLKQIYLLLNDELEIPNLKGYNSDTNYRFVASIREDFLFVLEDSIDELSMDLYKNNRYRLRPMKPENAQQVVLIPGRDCIEENEKSEVAKRVIALSTRPQSNSIDTLLLSLVCSNTFERKSDGKLTLSDFQFWGDNPMRVYYREAIRMLSTEQVLYIQKNLIGLDGSRKRIQEQILKDDLGENTYNSLLTGPHRILTLTADGDAELLHDQIALTIFEDREDYKARRDTALLELRSQYISVKALKMVDEGDAYTAQRITAEVLSKTTSQENDPYTPDAEHALRTACYHDTAILKGHHDSVISASFSPDGTRIASASRDKTIRIWDTKTGAVLRVLEGHTERVNTAVFSPDGKRIVSASHDNTIKLWDVETGAEIPLPFKGHSDIVSSAVFSPDGTRIASASEDKTVRIWNAKTGIEIKTLSEHADWTNSVAFSHDGTRIVSASMDGIVRIFDAETFSLLLSLKHGQPVHSAFFSHNDELIVATSLDRCIYIWDATTGLLDKKLIGHSSSVNYATFSPDDSCVVSASDDNTVRIWDVKTGMVMKILEGHSSMVHSAAYNNDSSKIVTASADSTIRLWEMKSTSGIHPLEGHASSIHSVTYCHDGSHLLSSSEKTNTKIVWDANTAMKVLVLTKQKSTYISHDGSRILSIDDDDVLKVWDTATGKELHTLVGHLAPKTSKKSNPNSSEMPSKVKRRIIWDKTAAFSPDGRHVVSISKDIDNDKLRSLSIIGGLAIGAATSLLHNNNVMRVWDTETGEELYAIKVNSDYIYHVVYSPNGRLIALASGDYTIRIVETETGIELQSIPGHIGIVPSSVFSPDSKRIVTTDISSVAIWDVESGQKLLDFEKHFSGIVFSAVFSPDGTCVLAASEDNLLKKWDSKTGAELLTLEHHSSSYTPILFSPNGKYIITASNDNTSTVWDATNGARLMSLEGYAASFSPDCRHIVTASSDKLIRIYDFPPLQELIDQTRERFKDRPLTPEERKMYYLE